MSRLRAADSAYIAAGIPPIVASAFWLFCVPALWNFTDSTGMLLRPTAGIPHHPPLYPIIVHSFELHFGLNSKMLYALLVVQHVFLASTIIYLGSAFEKPVHALIVSAAAVAGTWVGSFAHAVSTEGLDLPFLALLCGVALRFHSRGWRVGLLPMFFLSAVGLAMVRHASVIFAFIVPLYFILLALTSLSFRSLSQKVSGAYLRNAVICCMGIALAIGTSSVVTRLTCLAWGNDCSHSIIGRAGCYRIFESFNRVPTEQREIWLTDKIAGLAPVFAEAFALKAKTNGGCWSLIYGNIAKAFPNESPDRLMNAAFFHFFIQPDRFSAEQMLDSLRRGMYVNPVRQETLRGFLVLASSPAAVREKGLAEDEIERHGGTDVTTLAPPHDDTRRQLGETPESRQQLRRLAEHAFVRYYEWFTYNCLNIVAMLSLVAVMIFRGPQAAALGLSFVFASLTYLVIVSAVTLMLDRYIAPVNFLMYVLVALCICILMERTDFRSSLSYPNKGRRTRGPIAGANASSPARSARTTAGTHAASAGFGTAPGSSARSADVSATWAAERAGKANDMDTDDKIASQAGMRLGPLRHFLIKTVIVACAVVITGWIISDLLGDFVDRRIERALRSATSMGGTQFWTKVEKQLDQLADPKSDIPPEKKQKILTQIKVISDRWRPFLLAATASGDPDAPTR